MSITAVNPRIIDGTAEEVTAPVAASQTWSKGCPVILTAGALTQCAAGDIPSGLASEDIAAPAETSMQKFWRFNIGTRMEIYVYNAASASAIAASNLGIAYDLQMIGIAGVTSVGVLDLGATTDKCFLVKDLAANYEPERNAAADSPGKCIVEVVKLT